MVGERDPFFTLKLFFSNNLKKLSGFPIPAKAKIFLFLTFGFLLIYIQNKKFQLPLKIA